jgi:hypothetical protein
MPDSRDHSKGPALGPGGPDDPDVEPSAEELVAAEALRAALEDPSRRSEMADLARAVSSAWEPKDLDPAGHRAIVERALAARPATTGRRSNVVRVSFAASAMVALAASVLLAIWGQPPVPASTAGASPDLALSRSTQELFDQSFAAVGGESARVDRIAMARATDLRDNEFARWGVR